MKPIYCLKYRTKHKTVKVKIYNFFAFSNFIINISQPTFVRFGLDDCIESTTCYTGIEHGDLYLFQIINSSETYKKSAEIKNWINIK